MPSHAVPVDRPLPGAFKVLLASWGASLTGDGLRMIALPLLALAIDPRPVAVGLVAVATSLPWLLVAAPAGALVDRLNPGRVILLGHLFRCLVTAVLVGCVLAGRDSVILLCVIGFALTAAETFADAAAQSLLVRVVPDPLLERANARFVTVETLALDMVGPLSAGVLFLVRPWLPFAVSAAGFLLAALLVSRVSGHPASAGPDRQPTPGSTGTPPTGTPDAERDLGPFALATTTGDLAGPGPAQSGASPEGAAALRTEVGDRRRKPTRVGGVSEALSYLFGHPVLRTLVITVAVMVIANAATDAMLVIYATDSLNLSEGWYPTLLAAYSVGTLLAALIVGRLADRYRGGGVMLISMVTIGVTMLAMGLVVRPWLAWTAYALMGVAGGVWNVLSATRRQRHTPVGMIARVSSAFRVVAWGFIPLGGLLGAAAAQRWGVPAVFAGSGVLILLLALVVGRLFLRPEVRPARSLVPPG